MIEYIPGHTYQQTIDAFEEQYGRRLTAQILNGCCNHWHVRTGTDGKFKNGHVPTNKGKKVPREMQAVATQFKKGNMPPTYRPVGSERYDAYHGGQLIKTADPNVWEPKSRVVWREHHGEIPSGHVIVCRDGDSRNCDIENLACLQKREHLRMTRLGMKWNAETFDTLRLLAQIQLAKYDRRKQK